MQGSFLLWLQFLVFFLIVSFSPSLIWFRSLAVVLLETPVFFVVICHSFKNGKWKNVLFEPLNLDQVNGNFNVFLDTIGLLVSKETKWPKNVLSNSDEHVVHLECLRYRIWYNRLYYRVKYRVRTDAVKWNCRTQGLLKHYFFWFSRISTKNLTY